MTDEPPPQLTLADLTEIDVRRLKGVGDKKLKGLHTSDIHTLFELITHYPRRYIDRTNERRIDELIVGLTRDLGAAAVVVTHDIQSVLRVASRVVFLHRGRVHWSGDVSDLARADDPFVAHFIRAGAYAFPPLS